MLTLREADAPPIESPVRDGVDDFDHDPLVVSVSDPHGYLDATRSALETVGDHGDYAPLVAADDEGRLHWAGDDEYVLVFNGDLIDRGPDNEGVIALVERLGREAPDGHVRVTLGNHEWGVLFAALVRWQEWFSGQCTDEDRRRLCDAVLSGDLVAAYGGYNFTYAHAGQPSSYRPRDLNDRFREAIAELRPAVGTDEDATVQRRLVDDDAYRRVLALGGQGGRGFGAGVAWLDFQYLPGDSPPQVVGHTRQDAPVQEGTVVCENVIRNNVGSPGGEAVLVESPDSLVGLERTAEGGVTRREFRVPEAGENEV